MRHLAHPGQPALVAFGAGAAAVAYGSLVTLPGTLAFPGQLVLSITAGAGLLLAGAAWMAFLLAFRPEQADRALTAPPLVGRRLVRGSLLAGYGSFRRYPALRWVLLAAFAAAALLAILLLASDLYAAARLGWAIPRGGGRLVLG